MMMFRLALVLVVVFGIEPARAEVRGVVRLGFLALDLESSATTPVFGDSINRAVVAYNAAAAAHDQARGGMTARVTASDLGLHDALYTLSPGIELGIGHYLFRLEVPVGFGSNVRSVGVGVYPPRPPKPDLGGRRGSTSWPAEVRASSSIRTPAISAA